LGTPESLEAVAADIAQEAQVGALFRRIGQRTTLVLTSRGGSLEAGIVDHIVSTAADIEGAYELLPL
jgi:hypothetical protein